MAGKRTVNVNVLITHSLTGPLDRRRVVATPGVDVPACRQVTVTRTGFDSQAKCFMRWYRLLQATYMSKN